MDVLFAVVGLVLLALFAGLAFFIFKKSVKAVWGLLANTILGVIAILVLNFFGAAIPLNIITLGVSAIFGLLGVGLLLFFRLFGWL
ncbi:MAG: pro-sigmaK processing inhibitor BofA family protein [Candidatus Micrarchaeota archaeon]